MGATQPGVNETVPPLILRRNEGHAHPGPFSNLVVKAPGKATGGMYSLHEETIQPGDDGPPVHTHVDQEEAFYVLEGELTLVVGDDIFEAGPGTFALVPAGWRHGFANRSNQVARVLGIFSPRGFDEGFEEIGALIESGVAANEVRSLGEKWGVVITGRPLGQGDG